MSRVYVNNFATSLSVATTTSATSLTITSATGLPTLTGSDYYHLTLGGGGVTEIVKVTARTSTTLTVIRAQENTSAVAWAAGTPVRMNFTAASLSGLASFTWTSVSGTTQTAVAGNGYISTNVAQCNVTLPTTASIGDIVEVQGQGAGGFKITAGAGQTIVGLGDTTTTAGSITPAHRYDNLRVVCIVANTTWAIESFTSSLLTFA